MKNNWHKIYKKIAYRKLRFSRSYDNMQRLERFIKTVIGRKYKLNPAKIFQRKCDNDMDNIQEETTYFCSELVASAYKNMGILPKDISAS